MCMRDTTSCACGILHHVHAMIALTPCLCTHIYLIAATCFDFVSNKAEQLLLVHSCRKVNVCVHLPLGGLLQV